MFRRDAAIVLLVGLIGLAGCGRRNDLSAAPAAERLLTIGSAYLNATSRLGRPPRGFADLKPYLPADATEDYLRSPGDGERLVVLWGVDFNKLPPGKDDPFAVGAYEQKGTDGKRYVLRFPRSVARMTDGELRKANFPPGHKPPP